MSEPSTLPDRDKPTAPPLKFRTTLEGYGDIEWWRPEEMPPRKKREIDVSGVRFAAPLSRAMTDSGVTTLDRNNLADMAKLVGGMSDTDEDARRLFVLNEIIAWCYLKSWTLTSPVFGEVNPDTGRAGIVGTVPRPLPADADAILDLERDLYEHMLAHSAKIEAKRKLDEALADDTLRGNGFQGNSALNPASPTGASND